jgi:hypothetical protein
VAKVRRTHSVLVLLEGRVFVETARFLLILLLLWLQVLGKAGDDVTGFHS